MAEQTGAATYTYPIEVPPGRGGMQPELALRYSSRAPLRGCIAAGWSLSIPEIKLDRSRGEDEGGSQYRVSLGSVSGRLIEVPDEAPPFPGGQSTTYRAAFDGTFTRFIYRQRSQTQEWEWMALTTDGVRYVFDDDELPSTFKRTRWHVTRQVDPHGIGQNACQEIAQERRLDLRFRYLEVISETITGEDGIQERLPVTTFQYARPDRPLAFTEQRTVERGFDHFGTTGGAEAMLQDISGDGVLDRATAAQEGENCVLHWNKTLFGGDVAGGSGFLLHQIDDVETCSINGGTLLEQDGPLLKKKIVSLHFFDFTSDGVADLLTNRWFSIENPRIPDTYQGGPATSLDGSFVWGLGPLSFKLLSPPHVAGREDFPPSLPPAVGDEQVPRSTTPDASIPLFADLDGDGELDFIDVGTHPRLLGDGEWQVSLTRERRLGAEAFAERITWLVPEVRLTTDVAPDDTRQARPGRGFLIRGEGTEHQTRTVAAGLHDINGDGLPDLVAQIEDRKLKAFFNYGRGFRQDPVDLGLSAPLEQMQTDFQGGSFLRDGDRGYRRRMIDVDGDGLVDMLVFHGPDDDVTRTDRVEVHLNLGNRFTPAIPLDSNWARAKRLIHAEEGDWQLRTDFMDGDADLRPDLVEWCEDEQFDIRSDELPVGAPRVLSRVETERDLKIDSATHPSPTPTLWTWPVTTCRSGCGWCALRTSPAATAPRSRSAPTPTAPRCPSATT